MHEQTRDDDLHTRFAAVVADFARPSAVRPRTRRVHRSLVVQGDVALLPGATPPNTAAFTPVSDMVVVLGGDSGRHAHQLHPQGPDICWATAPATQRWVLGWLIVPEGSRVRLHHSAVPLEHEDLAIGAGVWEVRQQHVVRAVGPVQVEVRAERYLIPLWVDRFLPSVPIPTFMGLPIEDAGC